MLGCLHGASRIPARWLEPLETRELITEVAHDLATAPPVRRALMNEPMDAPERALVRYPLFKIAVARIQACFDSFGTTAEPQCCPIVGESGSGKTTIISYFASLYPRVDHKWGVEIPVLLAKVPAQPTVKSFADTLLYQLGDPLWTRGNTVSKSIRLRELFRRCHVRLLALDEFQHFVDARQASIPNDVADWLKEQVEETGVAIVVLGLQRCLEVLKQNEQLRRRFGATLRVGAFRWEDKEDRTTYRAFLRAVEEQLPEYLMPRSPTLSCGSNSARERPRISVPGRSHL
jgi:energy-coupling factor transporter ATP-binding protein EcfA2